MNLLLFVVVPLAVLIGLVWGTMRIRPLFYFYLFAFIPLYLLIFREYYFRMHLGFSGFEDLPTSIKLLKEFAWLFVLACFFVWMYLAKQKPRLPRELGLPIVLFCGYLLLEAVRGTSAIGIKGELLAVRENLLYVPVVLIAVALIRAPSDLQTITRRYAYVLIVAAAYAFIQLALQMETVAYLLDPEYVGRQYLYSSFFSDYNALGWFSGTVLGLVLPQRQAFRNARWLYYTAIFLAVFWMIASQSRTALVCLMVLGALHAFVSRRSLVRVAAILLLVTLSAGTLLAFVAPDVLTFHRFRNPTLSDVRFVVAWPSLWGRYWEHPLVGHGLGLFGTETFSTSWVPLQPDEYAFVDNYYFVLALTGGIVALLLFCFLLWRVFQKLRQLSSSCAEAPMRDFANGVQLALAVSLVYCLISNYPQSFPESVHIWFLIGSAAALTKMARERRVDLAEAHAPRQRRKSVSFFPPIPDPYSPRG
jgi:hypothetical protein